MNPGDFESFPWQGSSGPELPTGDDPLSLLSKKGYTALRDGLFDEAGDSFTELLALDARNNYALVGLGDLLRKRGDYERAAGYYQDCLRVSPGNNYALFGLADSYKALGFFQKALEIWQKYLEHDADNITVLTRVGDAFRKVRNHQGSKAAYLKVLQIEADNPYALIGLGHLYFDFKDYREALRCWERMEQLDPQGADIRVLTSLGNCHRKLKTYANGLPYFLKVLAEHPENFYALFGLADCYRGLNRSQEALDTWNKVLAIDPNNKVILTRAGDALRALDRLDEAEDTYRVALKIEYDQFAVLGIALIQKARKDYHGALKTLGGLMNKDGSNHRVFQELAECHLALGQKEEAGRILTLFQKSGQHNPYISAITARLR